MDDLRIDIRHEERKREANEHEMCANAGVNFVPMKYNNGETLPQILSNDL
ncbi:MAG: hypothetical protein RR061_02740 [Muribaculaceae bacterium]